MFPVSLADAVRDTFLIDPAVILIVVGVVMFFITFCGCIGALRENIRLLKTVKRHHGPVVEAARAPLQMHHQPNLHSAVAEALASHEQ